MSRLPSHADQDCSRSWNQACQRKAAVSRRLIAPLSHVDLNWSKSTILDPRNWVVLKQVCRKRDSGRLLRSHRLLANRGAMDSQHRLAPAARTRRAVSTYLAWLSTHRRHQSRATQTVWPLTGSSVDAGRRDLPSLQCRRMPDQLAKACQSHHAEREVSGHGRGWLDSRVG